MELTEIEEPYFSNWVGEGRKSYHKATKSFDENDVENVLENWATSLTVDSKLKAVIRHGMKAKFRARLWTVASGGETKIKSSAQHYNKVISELGNSFFLSFLPSFLYSFIHSFVHSTIYSLTRYLTH